MPELRRWSSHGAQDQQQPTATALSPQHSQHNTKKLTIALFHFIAEIPTINLTTEEVSVSPASYSVSLRKQMIPH